MPLEPVKIPQNVYIEDRIIGPLTLRQILLLALGGGFSYALYSLLLKTYGQLSLTVTVMAWVPAVVAAAFALVKINDLSLFRICLLVVEKMHKPSRRTFGPRRGVEINIRLFPSQQKRAPGKDPALEGESRKIRELSAIVDQTFEAAAATEQQPSLPAVEATLDGVAPPVSAATPAAPSSRPGIVPPADDAEMEARGSSEEPRPTFPVDPGRVAVDGTKSSEPAPLSDLSVFRDIFPTK
ncbi:MAG: Uncharacterized protein Greene041619_1050 [Candidatus Peregrinibacteria bacterium Greene0416_19]|nr:MAG: Uncharacterized protein Greene041619_1050 [Candidatus Peregrinibacteria bacterium Greene0416_19]